VFNKVKDGGTLLILATVQGVKLQGFLGLLNTAAYRRPQKREIAGGEKLGMTMVFRGKVQSEIFTSQESIAGERGETGKLRLADEWMGCLEDNSVELSTKAQ